MTKEASLTKEHSKIERGVPMVDSFFVRHYLAGRDPDSLSVIIDKVIILFLILALYLLSALEEIDWNILSGDNEDEFEFKDETIWNINNLIDLTYSNLRKR